MERRINSKFVFTKANKQKHLCKIIKNPTPDSCEGCFLNNEECLLDIVGYCSDDNRKDEQDVCVQLIRSQKLKQ